MKKFFGFIFFSVGIATLSLVYLIKADLVAKNSFPFMNFVFKTHNSLITSVISFSIILFIGIMMIGRIGLGIVLLLIGLCGMIFPALTKFGIVSFPSGQFFQVFLKDNFYVSILISFVIFSIGIFLLTIKSSRKHGGKSGE